MSRPIDEAEVVDKLKPVLSASVILSVVGVNVRGWSGHFAGTSLAAADRTPSAIDDAEQRQFSARIAVRRFLVCGLARVALLELAA